MNTHGRGCSNPRPCVRDLRERYASALSTMQAPKINYSLFSNHDLLILIIPLVIERALSMTVGIADSMMVASLGEASVSSVALVDMINIFLICMFLAMSLGGTVVASQFIGAKDLRNANRTVGQVLAVSILISVTITLLAELFNSHILGLLFGNVTPEVMEQSQTYFRITALTYPFISITASCSAIFRAQNLSKISLFLSIICNVINIIGNSVLIFIFKWGVAGAAYSTLAAQVITMTLAIYKLTDSSHLVFLNIREKFMLSWTIIRKILYIGIPGSIEDSLFTLGRVIALSLISKFGTSEIAANAIANQIGIFGILIGSACNMAIVTVVGQCVGAGIEAQLHYYLKKMMKWTYTAHFIWSIILLAFVPLILKCYVKVDAPTIHTAFLLILIHNGLGIILWPASFTFPNALRALNDVKATMCVSLSSMFIVRLGFSYLLAPIFHSGVYAVWTAMICDWLVRITLFHWRFFSGAWRKYAKMKA